MPIKALIYKYGNALIKKLRTAGFQKKLTKNKVKLYGRAFDIDGIKFDFLLNNEDLGLSRQLIINDWREYNSTKYLVNEFLGKNETIFDIGANIGYFALIEAAIAQSNTVYAIEPVTENYNILKANVAWNGFENITATHAAIAEKSGTETITICEHKNWSSIETGRSSEIMKIAERATTEEVKTYNLKDYYESQGIQKQISYIRMDVEGFEFTILGGNLDFLREHKPKLFIEFHTNILGKDKSIQLLEDLKSIGYTLNKCITNLEYCGKDLVFPATAGRGLTRSINLNSFIEELRKKSPETIKSEEGYELFFSTN